MQKTERVTYHSYLKTEQLLALQQEISNPKHGDELLFITIHQSHELWFKLMIHEIERVMIALDKDLFFDAFKILSRITAVFKMLIHQVEVLHTLSPDEFLGYRDLLAPASGVQSYQYKMIEFLLGLKDRRYIEKHANQPTIYALLKNCLDSPTVWDKVIGLLHRHGFSDLESILARSSDENYQSDAAVLTAVKTVYQDRNQFRMFHYLFEMLVELDLNLQLWRLAHFKNAERTIGTKVGTGGSSGIDYLQSTLSRKLFPELWEVRSII